MECRATSIRVRTSHHRGVGRASTNRHVIAGSLSTSRCVCRCSASFAHAPAAQHLSGPRLSTGNDVPLRLPSRAASALSASLSSVSDFRFHLLVPGSRACTKHLSGILIGAFLPLRVPETHRFPHSSNQSRAGSGSSCLRARARGRARKRSALRRPTNVRRGGRSPIKATGCRAWSRRPLVSRGSGSALASRSEVGSSWTAGSPTPAPSGCVSQEALHVERTLLAQDQVDGSSELGGQDRKGLGLAMPSGESS